MDMPYARALFLNARRFPQKPAVVFEERSWNYAQFYDRVARLGALLAAHGVGRGDRVSLLSENHPDMLAAMFAALALGASPAPINYRLKDDDIAFIARNSAAKVVFLGKGQRGHFGAVPPRDRHARLDPRDGRARGLRIGRAHVDSRRRAGVALQRDPRQAIARQFSRRQRDSGTTA